MQIFLAQLQPKVGNLSYNFEKIRKYYKLAEGSDICVFPELFTTGYTPSDLLFKNSFIKQLNTEIEKLAPEITQTILALPTVRQNAAGELENAVVLIQNGKIIATTAKTHLPSYGVFNEKRYFISGKANVIEVNGVKIGIPICEDIWFTDVIGQLKAQGAQLIVVPNASPFEKGKFEKRLAVVSKRYDEHKLPIIYCNQVLGHDGIVYDGRSFAYDGDLNFTLPAFVEDHCLIEFANGKLTAKGESVIVYDDYELIYGALVKGLRDYVYDNGFNSVIVGSSGGIDSALTLAIAVDAFGAENVSSVTLPSRFTSEESLRDARQVAKLLNISHQEIPIEAALSISNNLLDSVSSLAYENLQARIRGTLLMTISNTQGSLLLTTGNKSEIATGYCTLYGDMCGAYNPIKDLYKTEVYKIAEFRNNKVPTAIAIEGPMCPVMPKSILTKEPSAELRDNQKDTDSLPPYDLLDQILKLYLEHDLSYDEIVAKGFSEDVVKKVIKLIWQSEYKRSQAALGTKISSKDFGHDRRYPITCS
jgi:NAD+ synthase